MYQKNLEQVFLFFKNTSIFIFEVKQSHCAARGETCSLLHQAHLSSYQTHWLWWWLNPHTRDLSSIQQLPQQFILMDFILQAFLDFILLRSDWSPAARSGFRHPELFVLAESRFCFWDLSLYLTVKKKSQQTVHLTFSHCPDGPLFYINLLFTHLLLALGSSSSSWMSDHVEGW